MGGVHSAKKLVSLRVPQVLRFKLTDFLPARTGLLHDRGAEILEAAICGGVDISTLHGNELDLTGLDDLQERAIAGKQTPVALSWMCRLLVSTG